MMKPFTCVCLLAAAGSLLYLYQEKHAAQMVDREVADLVKQASQIRERTGLARAEWQMLNDPERLSQLASQHLSLQPLAPAQFARLSDLGSRLPGPVAAAPEPAAMDDDAPVVAAAPAPMATPVVPAPVAPRTVAAPPAVRPAAIASVPAAPAEPAKVQMAVAAPVAVPTPAPTPRRVVKPREADTTVAVAANIAPRSNYAPAATPVYAPIMPAFASQKPAQPVHAPVLQRASAGLPEPSYSAPAPFVGSALGMARATLAAPVPMGASEPGSAYGR